MNAFTEVPPAARGPVVWAVVAVVSLGASPASAGAQEYHVDRSADRSVTFSSHASALEFQGVTDKIDGYVLMNGKRLSADTGGDGTKLYLEVDLASLDTGIGMRDRHMRDEYLEVDKYPYASYEGHILRTSVLSGGGFRVTATGTLSLHGVSHDREIACDVTPAGEGYRARCAFDVLLSDYDIEIPKVMFLKLANEIQIALDFSVAPAEASRP
jgi:polyisoprenoid-binding protein YceI